MMDCCQKGEMIGFVVKYVVKFQMMWFENVKHVYKCGGSRMLQRRPFWREFPNGSWSRANFTSRTEIPLAK